MKTCLKTWAEDTGYEYKDRMKTLTKKRRRKTEEEKNEKWMNMSKMKKLIKTIARGDFEYNRNDDEYGQFHHE